jgi:hypothetical protein
LKKGDLCVAANSATGRGTFLVFCRKLTELSGPKLELIFLVVMIRELPVTGSKRWRLFLVSLMRAGCRLRGDRKAHPGHQLRTFLPEPKSRPAIFTASSDGNGRTSFIDPPLPMSDSALNQHLAIFSQHIASAFPSSAFSDGSSS